MFFFLLGTFTGGRHERTWNRSSNKDIVISHADINCASIQMPIYVHNSDTDRSIRGRTSKVFARSGHDYN